MSITRERLLEIIVTGPEASGAEQNELARMALAAMDSESGCLPLDYLQGHKDGLEWAAQLAEANHPETGDWLYDDPIDLAKAIRKGPDMPPAQPAPVVPEDVRQALSKMDDEIIAELDAEESACRAAMLQENPVCTCPSGDGSLRWPCPVHPGNSQVIPDDWTGNDKANAALMMLDRIETVDPVDDDRIDGIKRIVRELAAAPHDTPALNSVQSVDSVADRWIPVSERMPIEFEAVIAFDGDQVYGEAMYSSDDGFTIDGYEPCDRLNLQNVTHWMPLPAAPQEVKGE